jgi:hypothetical protein
MCNISKLCLCFGNVLITLGVLMYCFKHINAAAFLTGIGGVLITPNSILNFKRELAKNKKLDLFWFSKFIAMLVFSIFLVLYSIYILLMV